MTIWVFTICKDEAALIKYFLRHYSTFADRIIVFDEQSTDGTREALAACPLVELREWQGRGLDDEAFVRAINTVYLEARGKADWVMWPDIDELLYAPDVRAVLAEATEDMVLARGYALISANGIPTGDGQLYEIVRTGFRQPNYDKAICWRPEREIRHTIGRHSYPGQWPRCNGTVGVRARLKLLHAHHAGGVPWTAIVNRRNYERAVNKRYAWNYAPDHNRNPEQCGSLAWVRRLIADRRLIDVLSDPL